VEYFQTLNFFSAPERLTGELSKILSFPQTGHKHVIKGIQASATRTCTRGRNKRDTSLKAHAQDHGSHANDLTADC